jgi:DDE superfamily endonuclease
MKLHEITHPLHFMKLQTASIIFYQDETWIFKNMAQGKVWQEDGGEITCRVPSGSGDRAIVSHLGSAETGLFDGCLLLYNVSKSNNNADYHSEMKASVFLDWLQKKVFPKMQELGKKCVLVLDRATYHTRLTPHTKRMRKS